MPVLSNSTKPSKLIMFVSFGDHLLPTRLSRPDIGYYSRDINLESLTFLLQEKQNERFGP